MGKSNALVLFWVLTGWMSVTGVIFGSFCGATASGFCVFAYALLCMSFKATAKVITVKATAPAIAAYMEDSGKAIKPKATPFAKIS